MAKLNIVFVNISLTPLLATMSRSWEFLESTYSMLSRVPAQQQLRPALDNPMLAHICRHFEPSPDTEVTAADSFIPLLVTSSELWESWRVQLSTGICEISQCPEKAPICP